MLKKLILSALFAALTAVLAQIAFPIGIVPITLSIIGVFLSGFLSVKYALLAQIVYLLLGACGLPVFSNFNSGIGALLGPTGGFLMAYPFMAMITAFGSKTKKLHWLVLSMLLSLFVCYLFGTLWFVGVRDVSILIALSKTVTPFVLIDCGKIVICALTIRSLQKILK